MSLICTGLRVQPRRARYAYLYTDCCHAQDSKAAKSVMSVRVVII